jgi:hypothetical protein
LDERRGCRCESVIRSCGRNYRLLAICINQGCVLRHAPNFPSCFPSLVKVTASHCLTCGHTFIATVSPDSAARSLSFPIQTNCITAFFGSNWLRNFTGLSASYKTIVDSSTGN